MQTLSENLDNELITLCWSLWTELGVAGVVRNHQNFLVPLEELIILTASLSEQDPRLRDEALDWCSRYHHFISISRLRTLAKIFDQSVHEALSAFSMALNSISQTNWPLFTKTKIMTYKITKTGKSSLPGLELPALFNLKLRALFGVGARADLFAFFFIHKKKDFAASDLTNIGYAKRNLLNVLDDFVGAGIFNKFIVRNQQRYYFAQRNQMLKILGPFPRFTPNWRHLFKILLTLRTTIRQTEEKSENTKFVEISNTLFKLQGLLNEEQLIAPAIPFDSRRYMGAFSKWILHLVKSLAQGNFPNRKILY